MSKERMKELLIKLIYFVNEELDEENISKWFSVMFGISKKELKELEIEFY